MAFQHDWRLFEGDCNNAILTAVVESLQNTLTCIIFLNPQNLPLKELLFYPHFAIKKFRFKERVKESTSLSIYQVTRVCQTSFTHSSLKCHEVVHRYS